jgi:hypothetical protein
LAILAIFAKDDVQHSVKHKIDFDKLKLISNEKTFVLDVNVDSVLSSI